MEMSVKDLEQKFKDSEKARAKTEDRKKRQQLGLPTIEEEEKQRAVDPLRKAIEKLLADTGQINVLLKQLYPKERLEQDRDLFFDVHGLLTQLHKSLESLTETLVEVLKRQDEQRELESEFVLKLRKYLDNLR